MALIAGRKLCVCVCVCVGWGRWGGEGTKPIKKKQVVLKAQNKPRSDRELDHVIIGDHDNMKINKHLVSYSELYAVSCDSHVILSR